MVLSANDVFGITFGVSLAIFLLVTIMITKHNNGTYGEGVGIGLIAGIPSTLIFAYLTVSIYQGIKGSTYKQFGYSVSIAIICVIGVVSLLNAVHKESHYDEYGTKNLILLFITGGCATGSYFLIKKAKTASYKDLKERYGPILY